MSRLILHRRDGESIVVRKEGSNDINDIIRIEILNRDPFSNRTNVAVSANTSWKILREERPDAYSELEDEGGAE